MFACKNKVLPSVLDGLGMGIGFTLSLLVVGSVREILGSGTWFGLNLMPSFVQPMTIFILPAGGFFSLGIIIAIVGKVTKKKGTATGRAVSFTGSVIVLCLLPAPAVPVPNWSNRFCPNKYSRRLSKNPKASFTTCIPSGAARFRFLHASDETPLLLRAQFRQKEKGTVRKCGGSGCGCAQTRARGPRPLCRARGAATGAC